MPRIDKILTLEITPEQFLNSCSLMELQEIDLLLDAAMIRKQEQKDDIEIVSIIENTWKSHDEN